ncbi:hypothetical protein L083_2651 [Actinoplanes sp. N902-109]|nr:hypothetical protein L083_2651 [Actinoplanes sp. N902-109]
MDERYNAAALPGRGARPHPVRPSGARRHPLQVRAGSSRTAITVTSSEAPVSGVSMSVAICRRGTDRRG